MTKTNYYELLDLPKDVSTECIQECIAVEYRELSILKRIPAKRTLAEERLALLDRASAVLLDPESRRRFDESLRAPATSNKTTNPSAQRATSSNGLAKTQVPNLIGTAAAAQPAESFASEQSKATTAETQAPIKSRNGFAWLVASLLLMTSIALGAWLWNVKSSQNNSTPGPEKGNINTSTAVSTPPVRKTEETRHSQGTDAQVSSRKPDPVGERLPVVEKTPQHNTKTDTQPSLVSATPVRAPSPPVVPPPSVQTFQADPGSIERGASTVLRWSVSDAATVKIEPGLWIFDVHAGSGQLSVSPEKTTEYKLTAQGPGGTALAGYTVHVVVPPKPALTFEAEPASIVQGQAAKLYWGVTGASRVSIVPEIGTVGSSGSMMVRPSGTVTYTLTAEGPGGVSTQDATVSVSAPSQPAGELVWSGMVSGVQLVTIDKNHADVGKLEGSLPGTACIVQPLDERHVSVASSPGPRNNYERLVLRVTGKGLMRVVVKWSLQ